MKTQHYFLSGTCLGSLPASKQSRPIHNQRGAVFRSNNLPTAPPVGLRQEENDGEASSG